MKTWGAWVSQSLKHPTPDFSSDQDLRVLIVSPPSIRLHAGWEDCLRFFLSLCPFPNTPQKEKKKKTCFSIYFCLLVILKMRDLCVIVKCLFVFLAHLPFRSQCYLSLAQKRWFYYSTDPWAERAAVASIFLYIFIFEFFIYQELILPYVIFVKYIPDYYMLLIILILLCITVTFFPSDQIFFLCDVL